MPTYPYHCTACEHSFEVVQSFTDDSLTVCPECGGRLRKVFGSVGIVFKGSGFYRNDSRQTTTSSSAPAPSKDHANGSSHGSKTEASSTSTSSSDSSSSSSSSSTGSTTTTTSSTKTASTTSAA